MQKLKHHPAALALLFIAAIPASAGIIYTTGADGGGVNPAFDTNHRSTPTESAGTPGPYFSVAVPFTLSVSSVATDILVPLAWYSNSLKGSELDFYILSDSSGAPNTDSYGNPLSALYSGAATGISSSTPSIFDVSIFGSATLTASTTYWLEARVPGTAPCSSGCPNVAISWYHNYSSTKPAGYDTLSNNSGWSGVGNPTLAFVIENNATGSASAPEPASMFLVAGGVVMLFLRRRSAKTTSGVRA